MATILVLAAHPHLEHSRVTRALMRAAAHSSLADKVQMRDLYALYPDYLIDVAAEQEVVAQMQLLVWLHPLHWYGMTPLLKLWLDAVFEFRWAYGPGAHALAGKDLWLATSTGSAASAYRPEGTQRYFFDAFLPAYRQTAELVSMRFLPPLVLHGANKAGDAEIEAHARVFAQRLATYPDWPELADLSVWPLGGLPAGERPETEE